MAVATRIQSGVLRASRLAGSIAASHWSRANVVSPSCAPLCPRTVSTLRSSTSWRMSRVSTPSRVSAVSQQWSEPRTSNVVASASTLSSSAQSNTTPDEVLQFWYRDIDPQRDVYNSIAWFNGGPDFDKECERLFGECLKLASTGALDNWLASARGRLALVIVLDQISRNVYRNSPSAFSQDAQALKITLDTISQGLDKELAPWERWFLYLPIMHSEDLRDHELAERLFKELADENLHNEKLNQVLMDVVEFERKHSSVIKKFGRYPGRNAVLGRSNTKEEEEYLANGGIF